MSSMSSWQQISPVFTIQQRLLLGLWPLDVQYELSPCVSPYIVYLVSCLCVATAVTPAPASLHHTQLGLVMENICCWPKLRRGGDVWQCLEQSVPYPETLVAWPQWPQWFLILMFTKICQKWKQWMSASRPLPFSLLRSEHSQTSLTCLSARNVRPGRTLLHKSGAARVCWNALSTRVLC